MDAADGLAKLVVGCGCDGASIENNQIGGGGSAGAGKPASRERRFDGRSIGLRGAAAEGFDEESLQRFILSLWRVTDREQWRSHILGGAGPLRQRLFAWGFSRFSRAAEDYMAPHKRRLFHNLSGTVLEIGPGSGANLAYLNPHAVRWIGVEPNRFMHPYLARTARALGIEIEIRHGVAEELPAVDGSVDAVIATWVLCSVTDQARALNEVLRVLKPGGKFLFVEHVASPHGTWLRRIQEFMAPLWRRLGDGCHPDRETGCAIERAGFKDVTIQSFDAPVPVVRPHIAGMATKP
jgi:ubiquinone/menaquinone biosynthesis C-methylase UbiE